MGNWWHKEDKRQKKLPQGVEGAHLCIPIQCKLCWIRNFEGRDPIKERDVVYLACIKRANMDAIAGKFPLTILAHLRETMAVIRNAKLVNKMPS
jgi:hypothetical protein